MVNLIEHHKESEAYHTAAHIKGYYASFASLLGRLPLILDILLLLYCFLINNLALGWCSTNKLFCALVFVV